MESFWKMLSNQWVISYTNNINNHGAATSTSCFDFSTVHQTIPCEKLITVLFEIIDIFFNMCDKQFITVKKHGAK